MGKWGFLRNVRGQIVKFVVYLTPRTTSFKGFVRRSFFKYLAFCCRIFFEKRVFIDQKRRLHVCDTKCTTKIRKYDKIKAHLWNYCMMD